MYAARMSSKFFNFGSLQFRCADLHCAISSLIASQRPMIMLLVIAAVTSHTSLSNSHPIFTTNNKTITRSFLEEIHGAKYRQCKTDASCLENVPNDSNKQPVMCVDSFCKCAPNYRTVFKVTQESQGSAIPEDMLCVNFQCETDVHCQEYDHHRVCNETSRTCVCRDQFLEDAGNGLRCVPQYGLMPEYQKKARKYVNKNRISYRKDVEHLNHEQILWLQYFFFLALFCCQLGYLCSYVANRRRKMLQKIINKNLVMRQNSDQTPITDKEVVVA